jgi:hypothetical protein
MSVKSDEHKKSVMRFTSIIRQQDTIQGSSHIKTTLTVNY